MDTTTEHITRIAAPPEIGRAFVRAMAERDFVSLREALAEGVLFRMLVPGTLMTESNADATVGRFADWFGTAKFFELETSSVAEIEGRAAVSYRFELDRDGGRQVIEQHLMLDIDEDGRIERIDLLCSGFRSVPASEPGLLHQFEAGTLGCAEGLATEFRRRIQSIPVGDVLLVTTRDPAAKEDLPSLARMMGHTVRSIESPGDGRLLVTVERGR